MRFSLRQLGLIDAPQEEEYDNLTSLAAQLLRVPIAHVSVLDRHHNRIVYKSQFGHPDKLAEERQLPMELTYCQHVALTQAPVIVVDAREHPLLKNTPALQEGPLAYLGVPVSTPDGQVVGGLCMLQPDVRHWTEDEIESAKKLAASVSDLIRLKAAMLTSERLRQEQREFTYAISHDMKSPANTLHMILDEVALEQERLSPDVQVLLKKGQKTLERMGRQVEDVLEYSRTVDLFGVTENISLGLLVNEILNDLKDQIEKTNASINCGELPVIMSNRMQFRALLQNLIGNALKYRADDRDPVVEITSTFDKETEQHCLSVKDNGIGVAPEDQVKIFSLFARLHLQDKYSGTGIGLALCRRVAENHNGFITVNSDGQSGSTFTVTFPDTRS